MDASSFNRKILNDVCDVGGGGFASSSCCRKKAHCCLFRVTRSMKSANFFSDAPPARDRIVVEVDILKDKVLSPPSRFLTLPSNRA
jgi:hypothetical protein